MKLRTKSIITLVTMLLGGIGQVAAGDTQQWPPKTTTIFQLNGSASTADAAGTLTISISEPGENGKATATLTAKPATGNYITVEQISVLRTIDGSQAQTREPDIESAFHPTAMTPNDDPSGETVYSFTIEPTSRAQTRGAEWQDYFYVYDYEITANFLSRKSIETAVITLQKDSYTYTGEAINPEFTVKLGETDLTETTDYTVEFSNNTTPAKADAETNAPTITLTGVRTYTGTATVTFTIDKIVTELKYSKETAEATMGAEFEAPTLTVTPEGLQGITYSSTNTNVATIAEDGKVTIVGAGETTIKASFAGNETYEAAEASYILTVSKITTELKYSTDKATATMGAEFEAPTLTVTPEGLQGITYSSSNTDVATIAEDGKVTIVGAGETTITATFAGNETYEAAEASYTLTVEKGVGEGYALWIGDIQVTEDNKKNILGDNSQTFVFNPESNTLLISNNQDENIVIESRLDELTLYLSGDKGNKLKKIFYNNLGNAGKKGQLMFTTNFNKPGSIDFKNDEGESVITGFESVEFDSRSQLTFVLPEKTTYEYENGEMKKIVVDENNNKTTSAAEELSIGQLLTPIDETVTFTLNTLYLKDEKGNVIRDESGEPKLPNLVNSVVQDVLITLPASIDANSDEGISVDDSDGRVGITIQTESMTDAKVKTIAQKVIDNQTTNVGYFPGSDDFAKDFVGMTILLPACIGSIETDLNIDPGYEFHMLIAEEDKGALKSTIKVIPAGKVDTPFDVAMPSYCYIYMVKTGAGTRLGKRDKAHGKVYSVGVSVTKARSVNPPSEASGGALPQSDDTNVNEQTSPMPPTGITTVNSEQQAVKSGWYTLDGQKIAEPKQRGLYIKDGKKVVIK